jgi:DNA polymerase I-like protein with 3'-5' exonuclease and polymerase domains
MREIFMILCIDLETTGVFFKKDKIFGIAIKTDDGFRKYFDLREEPSALKVVEELWAKADLVVNQNLKFDALFLMEAGLKLDLTKCNCTMVRAGLIDERLMRYDLDSLAEKYIGKNKDNSIYEKLAKLFGGKATRSAQMPNLPRAPKELVKNYALQDVDVALELWQWQEFEIKRQHLEEINHFECHEVFPVVCEMEFNGVRVNIKRAEQLVHDLTFTVDKVREELEAVSWKGFNPNSIPQVRKLFDPQQIDDKWFVGDVDVTNYEKDTKPPKLDKSTLYSIKHPAAALILELRSLLKTRDTFIGGHILGSHVGGRVYPNINQSKTDNGKSSEGTGTGRLSYTKPALQQIPSRNAEVAELVKSLFLPEEGQLWATGDISSCDARIFSHYVNAPVLIEGYNYNPYADLHQMVADLMHIPRKAGKEGGANAKQLNLSLMFNSGNGSIAKTLGLPVVSASFISKDGEEVHYEKAGEEAQDLIDKYHRMIPGVKEMANNAKNIAGSRGYVRSYKGRHIRLRKRELYKASGLIYQASAADVNKVNLVRLAEFAKKKGGRVVLNTHDSYDLSLPKDTDWEKTMCECKKLCETHNLRVPMVIDFSEPRENWYEATRAPDITPKRFLGTVRKD